MTFALLFVGLKFFGVCLFPKNPFFYEFVFFLFVAQKLKFAFIMEGKNLEVNGVLIGFVCKKMLFKHVVDFEIETFM